MAFEFAQIAVTGPDGESVTSREATIDGAVVSQSVSASGNGAYVVGYRVVSRDGVGAGPGEHARTYDGSSRFLVNGGT